MNEDISLSLLVKVLLLPAIGAFVAWLGGRVIRNAKENNRANAMDDGAVGILEHYKKLRDEERERADLAFNERNKAYEELGALRSQVKLLTEQVVRLESLLSEYQTRIEHYQERVEKLIAERNQRA